MKKILPFFAVSLISISIFSQSYCSLAPRYDNDTMVFPNVTVTSNVPFGQNTNVGGSMQVLKMDIYEPTGDVATKRPLIVLAHGGSFIGGAKTDADQVLLCRHFAQCGYVAATIDYRLGMGFPINGHAGRLAVIRAGQDMKAALRYFRRTIDSVNIYRLDSANFFAGGVSAGAIAAVNMVYCDLASEIPPDVDTNVVGGMEGNSGNPGFSSKVKALINICGAVGDTAWIHPGDVPLVSAQGGADITVPYCTDMTYLNPPTGFPMTVLHGTASIHARALNIGLENPFHTFYNQGHTSPASNPQNADTTITLVSKFLYGQLGCTPMNTVDFTNTPRACAVYGTGVNEIVLSAENVNVFPNPSQSDVLLTLKNVKGNKFSAVLTDVLGRETGKFSFTQKDLVVKRNGMQPGIYFLKMTSDANELFVAKVIFE